MAPTRRLDAFVCLSALGLTFMLLVDKLLKELVLSLQSYTVNVRYFRYHLLAVEYRYDMESQSFAESLPILIIHSVHTDRA